MRIAGESPRYPVTPASPEIPPAAATPHADPRGPTFLQALSAIGGAADRGEALVAAAARGDLGGLDSAQLIALQAGIYRYSETVDLVAKLVDRASATVKTVLSSH